MSYSSFDKKIIQILSRNGRATWAELAQRLGLSPPAAADRVRKLEERGVILGYSAVLNAEALGFPMTAFVAVTLGSLKDRDSFLELVRGMDQVAECHHLAGEDDYLLKVRCRGTKDLERLLTEHLKFLPGVVRTRTTIVLGTVKETVSMTAVGNAREAEFVE